MPYHLSNKIHPCRSLVCLLLLKYLHMLGPDVNSTQSCQEFHVDLHMLHAGKELVSYL